MLAVISLILHFVRGTRTVYPLKCIPYSRALSSGRARLKQTTPLDIRTRPIQEPPNHRKPVGRPYGMTGRIRWDGMAGVL